MIRKIIPGILAFILAFTVTSTISAQRNADLAEENRFIDHFDAISVSGGIDVYLTAGNKSGLKVLADQDMLDKVITELEGDKLVIRMKKNTNWKLNWKDRNAIEVHLTYATLEHITSSGGSDVYAQNTIKGSNFSINCSGGSDVKLDLDVNEFICHTSGGSDANLTGRVKMMEVSASGGSDVHARELEVDNCIIEASGGSDTKITVNGDLEVRATGASDVYVYGNPNIISKHSSGASDIHIRS